MDRRTALRIGGSVGLVSFAGCVFGGGRVLSSPGGSLHLSNQNTQAHDLDVTLVHAETDETEFDQAFTVEPETTRDVTDAFGGGAYDAAVTLDNETTKTHYVTVGECSAITFHVRVRADGELRLTQDHCD